MNIDNSDVSLFFAGRQDMLTKYALVAIIVLCITVLGFTLLVHSSLCELSIKERNIEFKAVLAYESKKSSDSSPCKPWAQRARVRMRGR